MEHADLLDALKTSIANARSEGWEAGRSAAEDAVCAICASCDGTEEKLSLCAAQARIHALVYTEPQEEEVDRLDALMEKGLPPRDDPQE